MKLWIARDEENDLSIHTNKPTRRYIHGVGLKCWVSFDSDIFPEITFANSPKLFELNRTEK